MDVELAGFDLGEVEDVVDQPQKGLGGVGDDGRLVALASVGDLGRQQIREPDDGVHGRADFMAHIGEEFGFGGVGLFRQLFRPVANLHLVLKIFQRGLQMGQHLVEALGKEARLVAPGQEGGIHVHRHVPAGDPPDDVRQGAERLGQRFRHGQRVDEANRNHAGQKASQNQQAPMVRPPGLGLERRGVLHFLHDQPGRIVADVLPFAAQFLVDGFRFQHVADIERRQAFAAPVHHMPHGVFQSGIGGSDLGPARALPEQIQQPVDSVRTLLKLRPVAFVERILDARAVEVDQPVRFGGQPVFRDDAAHLAIMAAEGPHVGEENKQAQQQHDADHGADRRADPAPDAMEAAAGHGRFESVPAVRLTDGSRRLLRACGSRPGPRCRSNSPG